jgi:hypothetical protein
MCDVINELTLAVEFIALIVAVELPVAAEVEVDAGAVVADVLALLAR